MGGPAENVRRLGEKISTVSVGRLLPLRPPKMATLPSGRATDAEKARPSDISCPGSVPSNSKTPVTGDWTSREPGLYISPWSNTGPTQLGSPQSAQPATASAPPASRILPSGRFSATAPHRSDWADEACPVTGFWVGP